MYYVTTSIRKRALNHTYYLGPPVVIKRTLGPLYSLHTELSIIYNVAIETGFSLYPYY